jgi:RimJ/RimL family protein N-acetyltransferase
MKDAVIVGSILYGADEMVKNFVAGRVPHGGHFTEADRALGVIRRGRFVGGVVFHDYTGHVIFMSGAFDDPRWALPETIRALFAYPFNQLKVSNLLTATARSNDRARKIDRGLGFKEIGVIRHYWGKDDAVLMQMPRKHCRWLRVKENVHG